MKIYKKPIFKVIFSYCLLSCGLVLSAQAELKSNQNESNDFEVCVNVQHENINSLKKWAEGYQFVLVTGWGVDRHRDPMKGLRLFIEKLSGHNVIVLRPSSKKTAYSNSEFVYDQLPDTNLPLILIGHSKGGVESLMMVVNHIDLLRTHRVAFVATVQAPLKGARLADLGVISSATLELNSFVKLLTLIGDFVSESNILSDINYRKSLSSISHLKLSQWLQEVLNKLSDEDRTLLRKKIIFINTAVNQNSELPWKMAFAQSILNIISPTNSLNDGAVNVEDQSLNELGTTVPTLEASHFDTMTFSSAPLSKKQCLLYWNILENLYLNNN